MKVLAKVHLGSPLEKTNRKLLHATVYRGTTVDRRRPDVYSLHISMIDYSFNPLFLREVGSLAVSCKRPCVPL